MEDTIEKPQKDSLSALDFQNSQSMKVFLALLLCLELVEGFKPPSLMKSPLTSLNMSSVDKKKKSANQLDFLYDFFSHPFHAQGSIHEDNELDDMYKAQQQVLADRRKAGLSRDQLRSKYSRFTEDHLRDIPTHKHNPAALNKKEDDAMYVEEDGPSFEIPFLKNINKLNP